jgi:Holliday junction resolvasome RuvABC ATP-dependent DNA helicase subunit
VQHGIALSARPNIGSEALASNLHSGLDAMETVGEPIILSVGLMSRTSAAQVLQSAAWTFQS